MSTRRPCRRDTTPSRSETPGRRERFCGLVFDVVTDTVPRPGGEPLERDVILRPGVVAVVPIDERDRVVLVRQYRHPVGRAIWEIPAGVIAAGESPQAAAVRELLEETGYAAGVWEEWTEVLTSPGITDEAITVYVARELKLAAPYNAREIDGRQAFSEEELASMLRGGTLRDAKTILALAFVYGWRGSEMFEAAAR